MNKNEFKTQVSPLIKDLWPRLTEAKIASMFYRLQEWFVDDVIREIKEWNDTERGWKEPPSPDGLRELLSKYPKQMNLSKSGTTTTKAFLSAEEELAVQRWHYRGGKLGFRRPDGSIEIRECKPNPGYRYVWYRGSVMDLETGRQMTPSEYLAVRKPWVKREVKPEPVEGPVAVSDVMGGDGIPF